jgi:SAM-dependent methyltransferase
MTAQAYAFDPVWDEKYGNGHFQYYPWDFVVTFVVRNAPRDRPRSDVRIVEVGCGTGSNLWFAAREGFDVSGIDGSAHAVDFARRRFATDNLKGDFRVGDFTSLPFQDGSFDIAIDRGALTCVGLSAGRRAIEEVHRVLKPGGRFIFNPYSIEHSSARSGRAAPDGMTVDITEGTMIGVGQVCFYGRNDVDAVFRNGWRIIAFNHLVQTDQTEPRYLVHAEWRVVAEKRDDR